MIKTILILFLTFFVGISNANAEFIVQVGRSATSAPDTLTISWRYLGLSANIDSLMVRFDLNAAPLVSTQGNQVFRMAYTIDSGQKTVTDTIPEGDFVYFSLFYFSGSSWSYATKHSVFVQDRAVAYPRTAVIFTGWNVFNVDSAKVLSRFDMSWMNTNQVLGGADIDPRTVHASLRDYNPNMIPMIHEEAYAIHANFIEPTDRDTICATMTQLAVALADQATDTTITVFEDSTQLSQQLETNTNHLWIDDASIFPTFPDSDKTTPIIQIERGANMEWLAVDTVWNNAVQDSLATTRDIGHTTRAVHAVDTWVYYVNSHGGNTGSYGYADMMLKATAADTVRSLLPWEHKTKFAVNTLEAYLSAGNTLVATGILFDNYYKENSGYDLGGTHLTDDVSFINAAGKFISERDSSIYLGLNMTAAGFNGVESKAQMLNLEEKDFDTAANRWATARDLYHRMIEGAIIHSYRYGMAQADYMPSMWSLSNEDNNKQSQRFGDAIATVFGGIGGTKNRFDKSKCVWADHYSVNASGIATYPDSFDGSFHWLGWPKGQWKANEGTYVATELMTNGTFPDTISSWSSSEDTSIAISWDSGELKAALTMQLQPTDDNLTLNGLFDEYVESPTFAVADSTEYTVKFDIRADASKIIGVRLLQNEVVYQAEAILAPTTTRTIYLPVFIDTSRAGDSLNAVKLRFGLTPCLQPDTLASNVWIDNVSVKEAKSDSAGFVGWSREFDNGWVAFNFRESAQTFNVPAGNWKRIGCYGNDELWTDCTVNDTTSVSATVSIPVRDGLFLVKASGTATPTPAQRVSSPAGAQSTKAQIIR